jgi:hypothetical protein
MPQMPGCELDQLSSKKKHSDRNELEEVLANWDYPAFLDKREKLFGDILDMYVYDPERNYILIERVMCHDFEDGLLLAEKAQRSQSQYQALICNHGLLMRYADLINSAVRKVNRHTDALSDSQQKIRNDQHAQYHKAQQEMVSGISVEAVTDDMFLSDKDAQVLYAKIDELYAPLLRYRGIQLEKSDKIQDRRTKGERIGEEYLQQVQRFENKAGGSKPLDILFDERNRLAEKYNREELSHLLKSHCGDAAELIRNQESHQYEIKLSTDNESPLLLKMIIDISKYDEVRTPKDIGGKIFFRAELNGKKFIVDEKGNMVGDEYDYV